MTLRAGIYDRFDFKIVFRPGKQGGKPDALSCRPDYMEEENNRGRVMTFLKPEQINTSLLESSDLTLAMYRLTIAEILLQDCAQEIRTALEQDPNIAQFLPQIRDMTVPQKEEDIPYLQHFSTDLEEQIQYDGRVYVPEDNRLKLDTLQDHHDAKTTGHLTKEKTLELIARDYYWPRMRKFVNEYVNTCKTCLHNKTSHHTPHGELHPLPIPAVPWKLVFMDFIVELPLAGGYDAVLVTMDHFTKMAHFLPTTSNITMEQTAQLYYQHVWKLHGVPEDIISDRGPQFTSHFMQCLLQKLEIQGIDRWPTTHSRTVRQNG